jgi:uncharacterized protein YkwD
MLDFNWIDFVVVAFICYYIYEGWGRGLVSLLFELIGFVGSLFIALKGYGASGNFIADKFGLFPGWSKLIGFVALAIVSEVLISEVLSKIYKKLPKAWVGSKINNWLSVLPSILNGLLVASFFLLLVLGLPIRGTVKKDIMNSQVGSALVNRARFLESGAKSIFSQAILETAKFFTIRPDSTETVELNYRILESELKIDFTSEAKMLELVNAERAKVGAKPLRMDATIVPVARAHSKDMFLRGYFAHMNPDGESPFDRMQNGGVEFTMAGENLALAPDVDIAHQGLMDSPGHKRNILDGEFGRIGIGIIDGGFYGKMFTQNFAD